MRLKICHILAIAVLLSATYQVEVDLTDIEKRQILDFYINRVSRKDLECRPKFGFAFCSDIDVEVDGSLSLVQLQR